MIRDIVLIETGVNLGYAGGNNAGISYALANGACDYIWILNNDTQVRPDSLSWLVERMQEDPSIGMCGPVVCYMDQPDLIQNLGGGTFSAWKARTSPIGFGSRMTEPFDPKAVKSSMRFVNSTAMLVSRAFIETIGLKQDDYFLYFEEFDWAERAKTGSGWVLRRARSSTTKLARASGTNDFGARSALLSDPQPAPLPPTVLKAIFALHFRRDLPESVSLVRGRPFRTRMGHCSGDRRSAILKH